MTPGFRMTTVTGKRIKSRAEKLSAHTDLAFKGHQALQEELKGNHQSPLPAVSGAGEPGDTGNFSGEPGACSEKCVAFIAHRLHLFLASLCSLNEF